MRAFQSAAHSDKRTSFSSRETLFNLGESSDRLSLPPTSRGERQREDDETLRYGYAPSDEVTATHIRRRAIVKQAREKVKSLFEKEWNKSHDFRLNSSDPQTPTWAVNMMSMLDEYAAIMRASTGHNRQVEKQRE